MKQNYAVVRGAFGVAILFGVLAAAWSILWLVQGILFVEAIILAAKLSQKN